MSKPPSRRRPTTTNSRRGVSTGRASGNRSSKGPAKSTAATKKTTAAAKGLTARQAAAKVAAAKVAAAKAGSSSASTDGPPPRGTTTATATRPDATTTDATATKKAATKKATTKATGGAAERKAPTAATTGSAGKTSSSPTPSSKDLSAASSAAAEKKGTTSASAASATKKDAKTASKAKAKAKATATAGAGGSASPKDDTTSSTVAPPDPTTTGSKATEGSTGKNRRTGGDKGRRKEDATAPTDGRRAADRSSTDTDRKAEPARHTPPTPVPGSVAKTASTTAPTAAGKATTRPGRPIPTRPVNRSVGSPTARAGTNPEPGLLGRLRPTGRRGGVAPFASPRSRLGRLRLRRTLRRRGFVPLSTGRPRIHHRILPRTVIGISFMLLSFGVGAAFSGAAFYAYYDNRLAENEATVSRFVSTFDTQFADASGALDDLRTEAIDDIRAELVPLQGIVADSTAVVILPERLGPSIWALETRDDDGRLRVGSAFAVAPHQDGTAFVTSYSLVDSSTTLPGPGIDLVKDDVRLTAELWAWDADRDLAVVVVEEPVPALEMANAEAQTATVGHGVFAMGGVGGRGATASPGVLLDHSLVGIQHTAAVGTLFVGGPVVDGRGRVIGVATVDYQPYGVDHGGVAIAPDVAGMCSELLSCDERLTTVAGAASIADDDGDQLDGEDADGDGAIDEIDDAEAGAFDVDGFWSEGLDGN